MMTTLPLAAAATANLQHENLHVASHSDASPFAGAEYKFRLYVADDSENSALARAHLSTLCNQYLPDRHEIEVVDVFRDPVRAHADDITLTPTLIKLAPLPVCRIVGTLDDMQTVLVALKLQHEHL